MTAPGTAKAERLLNLVIALVTAPQYRSAAWIRRHVAGYAEAPSDDAFGRMFERDKNELRELNIAVHTNGDDGYRVFPEDFAVPELDLTAAEIAAVSLAARLWDTTSQRTAGEQGVRKLKEASSDAGDDLDGIEPAGGATLALLQPKVRTADPAFAPLQTATLARRVVTFGYRKGSSAASEPRRVQPWGLVSYRGRWYLIGHDLDRQAQRTFRLSRIVGSVKATGRAGAFEPPDDVDLLAQVRQHAEPEVDRFATVLIRPGRAHGMRRGAQLVHAAQADAPADDTDVLTDAAADLMRIPIRGLWDTARAIAGNGADVRVVEPADLQSAVIRLLTDAIAGATAPAQNGAKR